MTLLLRNPLDHKRDSRNSRTSDILESARRLPVLNDNKAPFELALQCFLLINTRSNSSKAQVSRFILARHYDDLTRPIDELDNHDIGNFYLDPLARFIILQGYKGMRRSTISRYQVVDEFYFPLFWILARIQKNHALFSIQIPCELIHLIYAYYLDPITKIPDDTYPYYWHFTLDKDPILNYPPNIPTELPYDLYKDAYETSSFSRHVRYLKKRLLLPREEWNFRVKEDSDTNKRFCRICDFHTQLHPYQCFENDLHFNQMMQDNEYKFGTMFPMKDAEPLKPLDRIRFTFPQESRSSNVKVFIRCPTIFPMIVKGFPRAYH